MVATYVNEGRVAELDQDVSNFESHWKVILFTAPTSVSVTTVIGTLTEATFGGYARVTPSFGASAIDGNGNAKADASVCTFTCDGTGTDDSIYGYAMIDTTLNKLLYAEILAGGPFSMAINGDMIEVTPHLYNGEISGTP